MTLIKDIFKVVWGMMTWQKPKRLQEKFWADFNSENDSSILFLLDKLKRAPRCFVWQIITKNRSHAYVILFLSFGWSGNVNNIKSNRKWSNFISDS